MHKVDPKEKRLVKLGIGTLPAPMTYAQAMRYAERNMPGDLRRAGFKSFVGVSDVELHGGLWYRIDYAMSVGKARAVN